MKLGVVPCFHPFITVNFPELIVVEVRSRSPIQHAAMRIREADDEKL